MKLTNYHRDAFVLSVMDDVPQEDYQEQYRAAVLADAAAQLPPKVRAVWDNAELRHYLKVSTVYPVTGAGSVMIPSGDSDFDLSSKAKETCQNLANLTKAQYLHRKELERKLKSIAKSCSTRKALATALPEFEKYLPAETETTRNLPVIANVVTDFIKAGWPKGKTA